LNDSIRPQKVTIYRGGTPRGVQFWEIYTIVHEHGISLREAWDGVNLRLTFRRTVDDR
jgi:hypothetical protein